MADSPETAREVACQPGERDTARETTVNSDVAVAIEGVQAATAELGSVLGAHYDPEFRLYKEHITDAIGRCLLSLRARLEQ